MLESRELPVSGKDLLNNFKSRRWQCKNIADSVVNPHVTSAKTFGGYKAVVRPVPIPNTAVKRSLANGSGCIASARVGYRQIFNKSRNESFGFFFSAITQKSF